MKKILISFLLSMSLVFGGATAATAQQDETAQATSDDDGGFDEWGLLGLAGLIGLAGLAGRDRDRGAGNRGTGTNPNR